MGRGKRYRESAKLVEEGKRYGLDEAVDLLKQMPVGKFDESVDLAVHSMKDMPTENPAGLVIAAIPERVDPRDALVGRTLDALAPGSVVGTGSVRRALQLRALRPDLEIRGIRGNVATRIAKQRSGEYDSVVLAMAGLQRLARLAEVAAPLETDQMVPAVGQGALAIQCRAADTPVLSVLESIHHEPTAVCVGTERSFLEAVSGGCSAPAACHTVLEGDLLLTVGVLAEDEHGVARRLALRSDRLHGIPLGRDLARRLTAGEGEVLSRWK